MIIEGNERPDVLSEEITIKLTNLELLAITIQIGNTSRNSRFDMFKGYRGISDYTRDRLHAHNQMEINGVHEIYHHMSNYLHELGVIK